MAFHRSRSPRGVALGCTLALVAAGPFATVASAQGGTPASSPASGASSDPAGSGAVPDSSAAVRTDACAPFGDAGVAVDAGGAPDPYACRLPAWNGGPAWPLAGTLDMARAFHWLDPAGESLDAQGEITGVGWVPITLTKGEASAIAKSGALLTQGAAKKAIKAGDYLLIQIETSEAPAMSRSRNLAFHIGTDHKNDPANNTPSSVATPLSPYQDLQDAYTMYLAKGAATPGLYSTDFAGKVGATGTTWYNTKVPFAARVISDPPGVQFLLPDKAVGNTFRPISFSDTPAQGSSGSIASITGADVPTAPTLDQGSDVPVVPSGTDFGAIGTRLGLFPRDGIANALVGCLEADTVHVPVILDALLVDGVTQPKTTLPSQTPIIWCTWPTTGDGDLPHPVVRPRRCRR